ncbi:SSI family serine proteinase inhibitor [Streptomyces sp. H39-S7]|uniref:SSI family serine proteinase inhibitor n=1 Tax=Streptomyces sp. H39-S7 TaxID=3004357 RepID=UPI0022AFE072|nr:SSI family serine proteinase inhibitor [Streptomyces sp. H39-S7]MCZ4123495.1 SSI family serine proteinase inhibitor [Streptomyces sp. H39-S7]
MRLNSTVRLDSPRSRPATPSPARPRPRTRLPLAAVLGVVLAAGLPLLLASDAGAVPTPPPASDSPVPPVNNQLTITVDDGTGRITTSKLDCGPDQEPPAGPAAPGAPEEASVLPAPLALLSDSPTGPARHAADSCDRLERLSGPVGPVPSGQMCSMIYGGSQTAQVTGVWHGAPVKEKYSRTNGCEVARWNQMAPVLPAGPGRA